VHTEKAGESLYFWRLGFDEIFERDVVQAAIRGACDRLDVSGLIAYELLGVYDLLLRAWLPQGISFDTMHQTLTEELAPAGLAILDPFQVSYMIRHWPFFVDGDQKIPADSALHNLGGSTVERVDLAMEEVDEVDLVDLERKWLLSRRTNEEGIEVTSADAPGIKFVTTVSAAEGLHAPDMEALEARVAAILDGVKQLSQRSLYAGSGFAHFLILGRTGYSAESFHALQGELISRLNAADLRETYGTHTTTLLASQRGYSIVSERLSGRRPSRRRLPLLGSPKPSGEAGPLTDGTQIGGRFVVKDYLGKGGFADVYRVFDRFEEIDRALKLFHSADPETAEREINALRKVKHPNVAQFKWTANHGARRFIVFEFIDGIPLNDLGQVSPEQALSIVIEVLSALEAIHPDDDRIAELQAIAAAGDVSQKVYDELEQLKADGLIHRDVKPENIMIGNDDRVVLVDFNIASPARDKSSTLSGTPEFFAPDAGVEHWDPADDLFSCGVVLYKLITGQHPFPLAHPVAGVEPIDPRTFVPELPAGLAAVMVKACRPLRDERYGNARTMREDLEAELATLRVGDGTARALLHFRASRTRLGISLEELAKASGLDQGRITRLESGDTSARPDEVLAMTVSLMEILKRFDHYSDGNGGREDSNGLGPPPP
jgi:serine/threonine-protein kinase